MNLIEHHIREIHSINPWILDSKEYPWSVGREWLIVDVTLDCHGNISRTKEYISKAEWEEVMNNGYFMR